MIEELGSLGEIIGAAATVATLIYLAYQIRQNTIQLEQNRLSTKAAAVSASKMTLRENRQSIFEHAEMAEIFSLGNSSPEELSELQQLRYRLVMQNVTEAMLDIYTQTEVTGFSPET